MKEPRLLMQCFCCRRIYAEKPCDPGMDGSVSHGCCPDEICWRGFLKTSGLDYFPHPSKVAA